MSLLRVLRLHSLYPSLFVSALAASLLMLVLLLCCMFGAQMNTDGHAKGYVFDGLHSHFPTAVPLIPIYVVPSRTHAFVFSSSCPG